MSTYSRKVSYVEQTHIVISYHEPGCRVSSSFLGCITLVSFRFLICLIGTSLNYVRMVFVTLGRFLFVIPNVTLTHIQAELCSSIIED